MNRAARGLLSICAKAVTSPSLHDITLELLSFFQRGRTKPERHVGLYRTDVIMRRGFPRIPHASADGCPRFPNKTLCRWDCVLLPVVELALAREGAGSGAFE